MNKLASVPLVVAVILALGAASAAAQTFTVTKTTDTNDGGCSRDCSLREAINAANATLADDTVVVPAGAYTLTLAGAGEDSGRLGDLDLGPAASGSITIQGAGVGQTIVDAAGLDRVFDLQPAMTATIAGLTAKGGRVPTRDGGIVRASFNAILTLDHVELSGGTASSGGGVLVESGAIATIRDSRIAGNVVTNGGGGIANRGTTTLLRVQIVDNHADMYRGGGVDHISGALTIADTELSANSADIGGGMAVENGGPATLTGVALVGNRAASFGGGLFNQSQTTATNTTIADNVLTDLGGMGSGFAVQGPATLRNATIAGNSGGRGAALQLTEPLTLQNTIVVGGCLAFADGAILSAGSNLAVGGCRLTGPGDRTGADAGLGALAANGGLTRTLALLPGSLAIDAANAGACPATDQRGVARPQGAGCDIGAYEATPVPPDPPLPPGTSPPTSTPTTNTPPPGPGQTGDRRAPKLTLTIARTGLTRLRTTGRLNVRAKLDEAAKLRLALKRGKRKLAEVSKTVRRAGTVTVTFRLSRSARKQLTGRRATLDVAGTATDTAGNARPARATVRLR
jgi:CSLREA domain-containing protein